MVTDEIAAGWMRGGGGGSKDKETTTLQPDRRFGAPNADHALYPDEWGRLVAFSCALSLELVTTSTLVVFCNECDEFFQ
eukprot:2442571-Ditylum_brightwellii.AAC.1